MNPDITITISTAGDAARGPVPSLSDEIAAESRAGVVRGPIPLPLDQLPGGTGATTFAADTLGAAAPPIPMDLDQMTIVSSGPPSPEDLETLGTATGASKALSRRRARRATKP